MTKHSPFQWKVACRIVFVAAISLLVVSGARGQDFEPLQSLGTRETGLSSQQGKVHGAIREAVARLGAAGVDRSNAASLAGMPQLSGPFLRIDGSARVQVYIELSSVDATRLEALNPTGQAQIEVVNNDLRLVQAWVPFDEIESLAALDFVTGIRPPEYGTLRTGSVTTQGDSILKADLTRSMLAYNGAGVKVGVISDGANSAGAAQATGDLPPNITVFGTCSLATAGTCNEGTAMMEIVYDLAPGATLAMGDVSTSLDFIQRVTDLKNWGAKVIVDDIGFFTLPYFEDGPVAAAYASAVSQGIVVVSAAGNEAQAHYQGLYSDLNGSHNFGGGDITMNFSGPGGSSAAIILQWSNRFGGAVDDYDLCVTNTAGTVNIACSANTQNGTQDPIEAVSVICGSSTGCSGGIVIHLFSGLPQTVQLYVLGAIPTEHVVPAGSIFGQAAAPGVISVGAINASDPGAVNIEPYSSHGPTTIFFPALVVRPTPTVITVDCVSDTGAGGFPKTFCGTSAAGPHAAAVAALLLQANPDLVPSQVASLMQNTAVDKGPAGFDNTYGAGLVDALGSAMASRSNLPPAISTLSPAGALRGGTALTLTVSGVSFTPSSVLRWNGSERPTTVLGFGQLTAQIPASDLANPGTPQLTVFTPAPGGGTSTAVSFTVSNPAPSLQSLSPAATLVGTASVVLTINGANFVPESVVRFNSSSRPTTFVSSNQIRAQLPASDLSLARTALVTVFSATPGGGTSAAAVFIVNNPTPTLGSLFPLSVAAGSAGFALTVNGTNFVVGSVVRWNGISRSTTFVSSTQLFALIKAADVAVADTAQITVSTPTPGGGISAALPFTIAASLPVFTAAGLVNGASFAGALAPGSIATVFGSNLSSGFAGTLVATQLPLPFDLKGTSIRLNGISAPLYSVSKINANEQINFQIPWELAGLSAASMIVTAGTTSDPVQVNLSPAAPGIFSLNSQGSGQGAILFSNTATFVAPTGSVPGASARPANRGESISIYCTGLGSVSNPPASGAPAGSNPASSTLATPIVSIGGVQVTPTFSGLSPGFVGLYQVDLLVPNNAPVGSAVAVSVSIGSLPGGTISSNTVMIAIQ